ncbi:MULTISPECIES: 3-hydroxyacyl-CoA dehydrogenase NAD-binding domain-containing protein [unclassified Sphingobium]|uniref:3-hydroxyacyl-CoA dehydrogenase NAD-binding domain-containing protein n=1 Tax=unclassified Sphingobium TaxID=2611147 RepID=UPI0035A71DA1
MEIRTHDMIAVVGAGTMGMGIAHVAAAAGHPVAVLDTSDAALQRARAATTAYFDGAVAKGRMSEAERGEIERRIRWSTELPLAAQAALVVEAIVEDLEVKRRLFGSLARVVKFNTLLASNTSSLSIGAIAEQLHIRGRFLGLHFFNPVPAMKLVEVVAGPETDPAIIDAAMTLMRAWGKQPVRVRDVPGFIVNRVARPYYAEGFLALSGGIDAATIDVALCEAGGFRMGPLALADLIGHDVNYAVASSVFEAGVGLPRFRPQPAQRALVEKQWLGRKSGRGVYDYSQPMPQIAYVETRSGEFCVQAADDPGLLQPLVTSAVAAGHCFSNGASLDREVIAVDDIRIGLGDGRSLSRRADVDVLIDHARDLGVANTLVISARSQMVAQVAADFLRTVGKNVLVIPDRPGQLVLRSLAQIANAAADTVADQIASPEDVETAMLFGANHPEGPLSWARRVGFDRVRVALDNIADETGDVLYEPSGLFGQS